MGIEKITLMVQGGPIIPAHYYYYIIMHAIKIEKVKILMTFGLILPPPSLLTFYKLDISWGLSFLYVSLAQSLNIFFVKNQQVIHRPTPLKSQSNLHSDLSVALVLRVRPTS